MDPSKTLLEAIAVTAELTATDLSHAAAKVMAMDLAAFPEHQVLGALVRCRRELRARLTIAEVFARIDDGRPGPEEAWAMLPKGEADSVVWTDEMSAAFGIAVSLENQVQARMAFVEAYREKVRQSREHARPVRWIPSLGHDSRGREAAVLAAVDAGRITPQRAIDLLPFSVSPDVVARIEALAPSKLQHKEAA